jgi:hypothetical protein
MIFIEGRMRMLRELYPEYAEIVLVKTAKIAGISWASTSDFLRVAKQLLHGKTLD